MSNFVSLAFRIQLLEEACWAFSRYDTQIS